MLNGQERAASETQIGIAWKLAAYYSSSEYDYLEAGSRLA